MHYTCTPTPAWKYRLVNTPTPSPSPTSMLVVCFLTLLAYPDPYPLPGWRDKWIPIGGASNNWLQLSPHRRDIECMTHMQAHKHNPSWGLNRVAYYHKDVNIYCCEKPSEFSHLFPCLRLSRPLSLLRCSVRGLSPSLSPYRVIASQRACACVCVCVCSRVDSWRVCLHCTAFADEDPSVKFGDSVQFSVAIKPEKQLSAKSKLWFRVSVCVCVCVCVCELGNLCACMRVVCCMCVRVYACASVCAGVFTCSCARVRI